MRKTTEALPTPMAGHADLIDQAVLTAVPPDRPDVEQASTFPLHALPGPIPEMVEELHRTLRYPRETTATAILATTLSSIGRTVDVQVREGYVTCGNAYLCAVGAPGTSKTHPFTWITAPLRMRDAELRAEANARLRDMARSEGGVGDVPRLRMVEEDVNLEGLYQSLHDNPRGITVLRQEMSGWWGSFNMYRPGADREAALTLFDGTRTSYTRKKAGTFDLPYPGLVVMGSTQPDKLGTLTKTADGLVPRILFSLTPDDQAVPYPDEELDPTWATTWAAIMRPVLAMEMVPDGEMGVMPRVAFLDDAAKAAWAAYDREVCDKINALHDPRVREIYPKLRTYLPRIALALEVLDRATAGVPLEGLHITGSAMSRAAEVLAFFERGALRVHHLIHEANAVDLLDDGRAQAYALLPDEFAYTDAIMAYTQAGLSGKTAQRDLRNRRDLFAKRGSRYTKLL